MGGEGLRQILFDDKKQIKQILNSTRIQTPTCHKTWENEQKNNINQYIEWKEQYETLKKLYIEPKLKDVPISSDE